ncbi:hypothetical protein [uncultured Croceitalea sp.]|uniref:hypothetical protein n=1 Tax=uncultured Croceitalea sp. TaxID=1798908 RepID=UPI00374E6B1D
MNLEIKLKESYRGELIDLLKENDIDFQMPNLLQTEDFKSEGEIWTVLSILIGSTAFWTSLASVIKQILKKTEIEIKYEDKNDGSKYFIKCNEKDLDNVLKKVQKLSKNNQNTKKKNK